MSASGARLRQLWGAAGGSPERHHFVGYLQNRDHVPLSFSILFVLHQLSICTEISFGLVWSEARFRKKIEQTVCIFQRVFTILNISSGKEEQFQPKSSLFATRCFPENECLSLHVPPHRSLKKHQNSRCEPHGYSSWILPHFISSCLELNVQLLSCCHRLAV